MTASLPYRSYLGRLMPRYFFHLADGERQHDLEGTDLKDLAAARQAAVEHAGEFLRDNPDAVWKHGQWRVEVTDEAQKHLFTVITLAVDAP
jgi:hypothetical protein